jgi:exonuclease III
MGVAETCYKEEGDFMTGLPRSEEGFRVIFSGGDKNRKVVEVFLNEKAGKTVLDYRLISNRVMAIRLQAKPVNLLLIPVYAPCEDEEEEEKEKFYDMIDHVIAENRKGRECLMVMGDFNGKVGKGKEEDTIGPFGVGIRNDNGQHIVELCKRHNLFATNTWYQQKQTAQHTWTSPDGKTKNQMDFILADKRYRNGVRNCKAMPGVD